MTTLCILAITALALGYGFGVRAQRLPFSAEIGFNEQQLAFLRWWVKLALVVGVLLPIALWFHTRAQPAALPIWGSYLLVVTVQLTSESVFSRWLVPSVVVPIGFCYTAFRLWQLLDSFPQLSLSGLALVGFGSVVLFWAANLVMLVAIAIPAIYSRRQID